MISVNPKIMVSERVDYKILSCIFGFDECMDLPFTGNIPDALKPSQNEIWCAQSHCEL